MVLPDEVRSAWDDRVAPSALATVDVDGIPNVIWVTCLTLLDDGKMSGDAQVGIADNYFSKTLANVLGGSRGSLVIRTNDSKPYQIKGRFDYYREGPVFEAMKVWNQPERPGKGVAVLHVEAVYTGAQKLC